MALSQGLEKLIKECETEAEAFWQAVNLEEKTSYQTHLRRVQELVKQIKDQDPDSVPAAAKDIINKYGML